MQIAIMTLIIFLSAVSCGRRQSAHPIPEGLTELCGDSGLVGLELPKITETNSACGISQPVEVHFVSGIKLNERPVLNCETAKTFRTWVDDAAQPSVRAVQARITDIRVVSSYACRTRNSQSGARLSEHAKGNAIDIAGFTLDDGNVVTVLEHWRSSKYGPVLKDMYSQACSTFGTTLGPDGDRFHQDHMHFDTADYRNGAYCR